MKIQQFIKSLNNTEIGKGGTHEYYVLVSKKVENIGNIFDPANHRPTFVNLKNGGTLDSVHITSGREFRINGLGDFYRRNNVNAGDEIIFERQDDGTKTEFFININTKENTIIFQKNSRGFEVLNSDRLNELMSANRYQDIVSYRGKTGLFEIKFKESSKKRSDSPGDTDFYSISFNGEDIFENIKSNEYLELSNSLTNKILKKSIIWQELKFEIDEKENISSTLYNRKKEIKSLIESVVKGNDYVLTSSVKGNVRFLSKKIAPIIPKTSTGNWKNKESFLFEIHYRTGYLLIKFVISPGEEHNREVLKKLSQNVPGYFSPKGKDWLVFYSKRFEKDLFSMNDDEISTEINNILFSSKYQIDSFEKEILNNKIKFHQQ
jgi:hypothetical protein